MVEVISEEEWQERRKELQPRTRERDLAIFQDVVRGMTYEAVGAKWHLSTTRAHQIVQEVRKTLPQTDAEDIKAIMMAQLAAVSRVAMDLVEGKPPPAFTKDGDMLIDGDGNVVRDHTAQLQASKLMLDLHNRLAKMFGIDAPVKADVTVHGEDQATKALAEDAAARLAGLDDDPGDPWADEA